MAEFVSQYNRVYCDRKGWLGCWGHDTNKLYHDMSSLAAEEIVLQYSLGYCD